QRARGTARQTLDRRAPAPADRRVSPRRTGTVGDGPIIVGTEGGPSMSRVIVIGGHGKVAMQLHPLLVARGDEPTGVIRAPEHGEDLHHAGAQPVVADVERLGVDGLADLLRGYDAVVWSAGAGGGDPDRTYAVDRDAAARSMDAAVRAGVRRYVMV